MATTRTRPAAPPDLDAEAEVDLGRYGHALLARWWLLLARPRRRRDPRLPEHARRRAGLPRAGGHVHGAAARLRSEPGAVAEHEPVGGARRSSRPTRSCAGSRGRSGMTEGQLRNGTSVTAVQGFNAKLNQTPLIAITVKGPEPGKVGARPRTCSRTCSCPRSRASRRRRSRSSTQQIATDNQCIKIANAALGESGLSTTDKILLQGRLQGCQADLTTTTQLSLLAKNVEAPRDHHARRRRRRRPRAATATPPPSAR